MLELTVSFSAAARRGRRLVEPPHLADVRDTAAAHMTRNVFQRYPHAPRMNGHTVRSVDGLLAGVERGSSGSSRAAESPSAAGAILPGSLPSHAVPTPRTRLPTSFGGSEPPPEGARAPLPWRGPHYLSPSTSHPTNPCRTSFRQEGAGPPRRSCSRTLAILPLTAH